MELNVFGSEPDFTNPYSVKCVVLGDQGVGKTTLATVFNQGYFDPDTQSTIGVSFVSKNLKLIGKDQSIKVQVWDTAGLERFFSIVASYIRDSYIALMVFDMTRRESWDNLVKWKNELDKYNKYKGIPIPVLIGTKSDLPGHEVSPAEITERAKEWNCKSYIVASNQNYSPSMINRIFYIAVEDFHNIIVDNFKRDIPIPSILLKSDMRNVLHLDKLYEPEKPGRRFCCFQ